MYILGISAFYHDSAAALLKDDAIVAAAQEERFTRIKHDSVFPVESITYCLKEADISLEEVSHIVFYEKPFIKFERLLETYLAEAPRGIKSFMAAIPVWLKEKLFLKETILRSFMKIADMDKKELLKKLRFAEHHQSHAASAFYPSPFEEAAILTVDGVGEWATTTLSHGKGNRLEMLSEIKFPHSLGLLYSAVTYYTGFTVNSGEYKVMGLAPYGEPVYTETIKEHLIDIKDDGSFRLNMEYFNYTTGLTMTNARFEKLFGFPPREKESELTQHHMDLARSVQEITEEVMLKLARHAKSVTGSKNLCLSGGVALNSVANGKILEAGIFENIWIQPASGDAGGSLGAAYALYHDELGSPRTSGKDKMQGSYLGPKFSGEETKKYLDRSKAIYHKLDEDTLIDKVADALNNEMVIGWHQGRMEFGPRALGARSIIGDARSTQMQSIMNLKIKYRESFRPFAPSVLAEKAQDYFKINTISPYMVLVVPVNDAIKKEMTPSQSKLSGIEKLKVSRSEIPAVTHVDYSARIQTVNKETNPRYYKLIKKFEQKTGCAVIINTSFNVRGEPIVCAPKDSYRCFMHTKMDILVIDDYILYKNEQPLL